MVNFILRTSLFALAILFLNGCSSGKKSLNKGDYDKAVYQAISRLKNSTSNNKALQTLKKGYRFALDNHLERIQDAKLSDNILRWEQVAQEYQAINNLADAVRACPTCLEELPGLVKYNKEISEAKYNAAEVRYARGKKYLKENNRLSAKQAYFDFETAEQFYADFKDSRQLMDTAYMAAVLKVVVEPVRINFRLYELNNEYFQNKINEFMANYERRSFIKFYSQPEASRQKLKPDQVLSIDFDDFIVGQTYVKERIEDVSRDSVIVGETKLKKPVYGTVKAQVISYQTSITSSGLLDFRIMDWQTKKIITNEKMPGTFVWLDEWGTFRGDERALSDIHRRIINQRQSTPPPPQVMFLEFTKPIYNQLIYKVRNFYASY